MTSEARYQRAMQIWPELGDKCPACDGDGFIVRNPGNTVPPLVEYEADCPGCHATGMAPPPFSDWMGRLVRANNGVALGRVQDPMKLGRDKLWVASGVVAATPEEAQLNAMLLAGRV